jgi:hypothetical protein
MANDKTKRSIKICFPVLLHNKREMRKICLAAGTYNGC